MVQLVRGHLIILSRLVLTLGSYITAVVLLLSCSTGGQWTYLECSHLSLLNMEYTATSEKGPELSYKLLPCLMCFREVSYPVKTLSWHPSTVNLC